MRWVVADGVSVIIPVWNAEDTLARAAAAVQAQLEAGDELILVDDGSEDGSAGVAARLAAHDPRVRVERLGQRRGVAAARNHALRAARCPVVFFTDADAELTPGALAAARARMGPDGPVAVVGIYAAHAGARDVVSRYKNHWIRASYLDNASEVDWLFGCATAARRDALLALGGFDEAIGRDAGGSDVELGLRLAATGARLVLDPRVEVVHHRRFTLGGLLHNDLRRTVGYLRIADRHRVASVGRLANIPWRHPVGALLLAAAVVTLPLPSWSALLWTLYVAIHLEFYGSLVREGGVGFAVVGAMLQALTQVASLIGAGIGLLGLDRLRRRR